MDRNSTSSDLDEAYSPSSVAGNYREIIDAYGSTSRRTLQRSPAIRVRYGNHPDEYVLLFEPDGGPARALLVFFHGGYWQELSAEDACFPADTLLERGIGYAAVNYTLAPRASVAQIAAQCAQAVAMLAVHRPAVRIVLAGSSAGAHLAAMLMTMDWSANGVQCLPFDGAVLLSGVYDLRPLVATYINAPLGLNLAAAAAPASPMLCPLRAAVPAVVCWGEYETAAFKQQSRAYAHRLACAGKRVSHYEVAGRNHFDILFDLTMPHTRLGIDTLELLGEKP
ncbi:alpha/beta hydrolase [Paraburkholderia acidicola]|uniref:Alpha/beta hydrolase n=1 Tax=Paraburkholderia acidicola TaxID=1912599 RepID=A0ABV1LEZ3_9BURK